MVELSPKSQRVAFAAALLVFAALSVPVMQDVLTAQVASRMRNTSEIRMQDDMRRTDPGTKYFMTKGTNWNSLYNGGAVGDDYHINERGQGTYALWYFTNVKSGDYNLDLTWPDVGVDLSDNLEIWVLDYAQGKGLYGNKDWAWILQQHPFSQEFAPSGQPDRSGISWGRVNHGQDGVPVKLNILGGDIVYVLIRPKRQSNYIADAVRLVPVDNFVPPPPPLFEEIIIDNEDSRKIRFRPEDNWYSDIGDYDAGYDGSTHIYDGESSGTAYAVWNLNEVQQGNYTLYATWNRDDIARNVNVLSYIDGEMDFETMDQSRMPSVEFDGNDSLWKRVMEIYIPPKDRNRNISALIYFWNRAENRIIADAIMLVPDGMEPPSSDCEDYDDNEADCFEAGCYFDYLDGICSEERLECTDELDQDDDPKIKGNIWGYVEYILDGKGRAKSEDTCDGLELQQVYCSDDEFLGINTLLCANACDEGVCVDYGEPYCADVDTRSENWRVNNNGEIERIKDDNCKGCKALCLNEGTRSEGWYSSCGEELIKYDNCSGEEEVYNIHVRGVLRDQMTSAPIGRAELTSPYEFEVYSTSPMIVETFTSGGMQIKKYYTNEQGVFDFLVRSDFRTNLENPEDNTSDESGWWNFKRGCYHWSGFGLRKGDDGDLELSKTIFDQSETWQSTDGRNFVNVHALPAYPFADIHLQSDQPVSFDVNYHYKNLSGTNGPGVGNFSTDRGLMTALPLDYDVHLTLMDENGQEYQSPVYRTPREAMCKQLEFGFFDGEGEWSFCGNGEVEGTEDCDDGNDNDEDGCSNNCDSGDSDCEGIEDKEVCRLGISSGLCYWDDEKRECSSDRKLCFDQDGYLDDYGAHNALSITYGYELGDQDQVDVSRDGHEDYCGTAGSEAGKLKEYYCRDEYHVGFELVDCPYGCEYGACLRDLSKCGDGILNHPYEYCDDGNTDPRDGCDQYCKIEIGWTCEVGPSICPAQCTSNDECSGDQVCVNGTCTEQQLCSDPDAAPGRVFVTGSWQCRPGEEEGGNFKLKMRGEKVRELFGFEERQYDISKDHGISDSDGIDCGRSLRGLHIHPTEDSSINLIANPNSQTDGICHRNPQIRIRGEYQSTEFEVQDLENCYLENSYELYDTDNCWTEDGVQQCEKERVYSGEFVCYDAELGFGDTECETDSDCPNEQVCLDGECVSNATLTIAVKNIGYEDTAVENQKNINLLRFEASASAAEDLLLTKIILDVDSGSLLNGQNYALWVDTDYNYNEDTISNVDTILEDGVSSQTQQVIFNNLAGGGFVIPDGQTVIFEVHTDIASSLTGDDLQVRFDADAGVVYLEAEILDDGSPMEGISTNGECENDTGCKIFVTTVESQNWNLRRQGNLFVTQSTVPLRNHQLLGGELGETILRLRFRADNEDIDVTDIQLTASGSTTSAEVDRLDLYREGQSWAFARATIGGCGNDDVLTTNPGGSSAPVNTFCANMETRQLVITGGTVMDVLVRPRLKTDVQGATSGQVIQFFIDKTNVSDEATGSGAIRARGDASSNNLSGNDGDYVAEGEVFIGTDTVGRNEFISGGKNISVMSEIVTITNASDDPSGTQVPIGLSDIGAFEFTAANHNNSKNGMNDAVLSGIILNVNATNVVLDASLGNFRLYNKADSTITQNCTAHANDGTILSGTVSGPLLVVCDGLEASSVDTNIDRGESITLILQGNITNQNNSTVGASSTLQVSIQNFDSIDRTRFSVNDNNASHIHWLDEDGEARNHFFWIEYPTTVIKSTSYSS